MLGKAVRILSRICDVILGLVTKRHMKSEHNIHRSEKYFWRALVSALIAALSILNCISASNSSSASYWERCYRSQLWLCRSKDYLLTILCLLFSMLLLLHWENCLHFVYSPRCVSFFYAPNCINKGKGKVVYGQEPPSGESTTTECGFNYQLRAVITEVAQ